MAVRGPGRDTVQADLTDTVRADCEVVSKPKPPPPPPAPPPPPRPVVVPTAASPCMLSQNAEAAQNEAAFGFPLFHEGPLNVAGAMPTGGVVRAVVIAVDFPDAVATQDAAQLATTTTSGLARFEEYSYGGFSVSSQIAPGWRRMPRPASSYASLSDGGAGGEGVLR